MTAPAVKPIGRKAYGSIGHLPCSRMGPADHHVHPGQARICTEKTRDKNDRVIVQEKLDGSCVAVAKVGGELHAIGRAGWLAQSSPHEMHQLFAAWVRTNATRFDSLLLDGERVVGEWLAQAHGTIYELGNREPFAPFDIMRGESRLDFDSFRDRVDFYDFQRPHLLFDDYAPCPVHRAMAVHEISYLACDEVEGVVYRVERNGEVDFLAKYVRPDKVDGKYLGGDPIWLWRPEGSQ